jgi:hypothetical protein
MVFRRALVASAILAVSSSGAWAQSTEEARPDDPARPQVQTFETVLGRYIEIAGRNFATRAREMAPEMMPVAFQTGETPNVTGVAIHDMGLYVFHVQVPGIGLTLQVMNLMVNRPQFSTQPPPPQQNVSNGRVEPTGVIESDPMGPAPARRPDFLVEYRNQVREALIDAIVDNSGSLPMTSSETLLVVAAGVDSPVPNPLYRTPTRRLVLRAKASDLAAFRENRISRDEVKRRVLASSF